MVNHKNKRANYIAWNKLTSYHHCFVIKSHSLYCASTSWKQTGTCTICNEVHILHLVPHSSWHSSLITPYHCFNPIKQYYFIANNDQIIFRLFIHDKWLVYCFVLSWSDGLAQYTHLSHDIFFSLPIIIVLITGT